MDESKNAPTFLGRSIDRSFVRMFCFHATSFCVLWYKSTLTVHKNSNQFNSIQFNSLRCGVVWWVPAVRGWMVDTVHKTFISVIGKHTA